MKAVLVMHLPKDCISCELFNHYGYCHPMHDRRDIPGDYGVGERPEWCPIRPLPEKRLTWHDDEQDDYEMGWNACLDAITGGKQ